jgi:hypothetical protein
MTTRVPPESQPRRQIDILLLTTGNRAEQPLLLGTAATHLRRQGFAPRLRDLAVQPLAGDQEIAALTADLVTLGIDSPDQLPETLALMRRLVPVLAGHGALCCFGPAVGPVAAMLLAAGAHACIRGEWAKALLTVASEIQRIGAQATAGGSSSLAMSYGRALALRELDGLQTLRYTTPVHVTGGLPDVSPARDLMPPLAAYTPPLWASIDMPTPAWGQVMTTRPAAIPCALCPLAHHSRVRRIERRVILDDIATLVAMGASHISFANEDFLADYEQSLAITRALSRLYPGLSFDFRAPVRAILQLPDVVMALRRRGATGVGLVLEATSGAWGDGSIPGPAYGAPGDGVPIPMRSVSLASLEEALALCSQYGLHVRPVLRRRPNWSELAGVSSSLPAHQPGRPTPAPRDGLVPPAIGMECLEDWGRLPWRKRGSRPLRSVYQRLALRRQRATWQEFRPDSCSERAVIASGRLPVACCLNV